MKSMSLALTLFTLTGALVTLDLSGELGVQSPHQQFSHAASISQAYGGTPYESVNAEAEEDEDEPDAQPVNAFLVAPHTLAPADGATTKLQHDSRDTFLLPERRGGEVFATM